MPICAVVAEYNPFHNGHRYHLSDIRSRENNADIVVIMSGNFVQRGEPAIANKRLRTEWALRNGADMVIELPCYYALSNAQCFAKGAIDTLAKSGIVDAICFGCETDSYSVLSEAANIDIFSDERFKSAISNQLTKGVAYPKAVHASLTELGYSKEIADIYSSPNSILGIEYMRAIRSVFSELPKVILTKRAGVGHDSKEISSGFASASHIRSVCGSGGNVNDCVPNNVSCEELSVFPDDFSKLILYALYRMTADDIRKLPDVSEGLENVILRCAKNCSEFSELCAAIKSKRYTMARIKRILMCAMLGITASDTVSPPQYIRVLGVREDKRKNLLSRLTECSQLPIVISTSDMLSLNSEAKRLLDIDMLASDVYGLVSKSAPKNDMKYRLVTI